MHFFSRRLHAPPSHRSPPAGKKAKTTNFMIAIRPAKGGAWQFLDGAGLRQDPEMLYQLLPKLQPGITLPENTVEVL